jgi:deoxyadenosine/deoxycytidine kinase
MKIFYIIGMPGTGKSTIMKELMSRFNDWKQERVVELLDTHVAGNLRVLGKYEDDNEGTFDGTDRLSMAVPPRAVDWISTRPDEFIVGEGDRLNNKTFFHCCEPHLTIVHITSSKEERERRYEKRGSNQSEKFIKTTQTKCQNIIEQFGDKQTVFGEEKGCVVDFKHETPEDTKTIVDYILKSYRTIPN